MERPPPTPSEVLARFEDDRRRLMPAGARLLDVHTHLGRDEDGRELEPARLLELLDAAGIEQACTFALHDPERAPAFRLPNDRVLGWASEHPQRLIPFCRVDLREAPLAEASRCLEAGARGIKLHPRAQRITFAGEQARALGELFRLAAEARAPVLLHTGRGLPAELVEPFCRIALDHPQTALILAHAAIWDQARITAALADHPLVAYDTSCFHPLDVVSLLCRVPAERILFGSDPPYGRPSGGLYLLLRAAKLVGLERERLVGILGGNGRVLLDRYQLPPPQDPPTPPQIAQPLTLARLQAYLLTAAGGLFAEAPERALETLAQARTVRPQTPGGPEAEVVELVDDAAGAAIQLIADGGGRGAVALLHSALALLATAAC